LVRMKQPFKLHRNNNIPGEKAEEQ
jgi:hypothetical protein